MKSLIELGFNFTLYIIRCLHIIFNFKHMIEIKGLSVSQKSKNRKFAFIFSL